MLEKFLAFRRGETWFKLGIGNARRNLKAQKAISVRVGGGWQTSPQGGF